MANPISVLDVEIRRLVQYRGDIDDPSVFATEENVTTPLPLKNFFVVTLIGDIRAVNGHPAKGTYVGRTRVINTNPSPIADSGAAIADVTRTAMREHIFEILNEDDSQIGTIISTGFSGGQAPPGTGAPHDGKGGDWAIVGGTGAYLGARGQLRGAGGNPRPASMREDPGRRRHNTHDIPGDRNHFLLHLIPMQAPEIMTAPIGPLIFGHDFTLVTAATPALPNHDIILFATGLGPTNPDVDLTQPFPPPPPPNLQSPLTVTVDGVVAEHAHAAGIPGTVNGYQVRFKMPDIGAPPRQVPIRLSVAWMDGPTSTIWTGI
jgi:hypothetical protein